LYWILYNTTSPAAPTLNDVRQAGCSVEPAVSAVAAVQLQHQLSCLDVGLLIPIVICLMCKQLHGSCCNGVMVILAVLLYYETVTVHQGRIQDFLGGHGERHGTRTYNRDLGRSPQLGPGQSPWWGSGCSPLKLEAFCQFSYKRGTKS